MLKYWRCYFPSDENPNCHIVPMNDQIEHELSEDCVCGPGTEGIKDEDGSIMWMLSHSSLDGREQDE